jgi:hypothetical protein
MALASKSAQSHAEVIGKSHEVPVKSPLASSGPRRNCFRNIIWNMWKIRRFSLIWGNGLTAARLAGVWQALARVRPVLATSWPALAGLWPPFGHQAAKFNPRNLGMAGLFEGPGPKCWNGRRFSPFGAEFLGMARGFAVSPQKVPKDAKDKNCKDRFHLRSRLGGPAPPSHEATKGRQYAVHAHCFSAGRSIFAFQREAVFSQTWLA